MKVRLLSRVVVGVLVVGAFAGVVGPVPWAGATPGGAITITGGVVHGTSGDDLFVLTRDDAFTISHNRYAAGDPGFASATDFDSSAEGVQPYSAQGGMNLDFDLGAGSDVVKVVGGVQRLSGTVDMGSGSDVIDFSGNGGSSFGASPTIEKIIGSPGDDSLGGTPNQPLPITILGGGGSDQLAGTEGNDILDASGGGDDSLEGRGGNDTLSTSLPLLPTPSAIVPGDGQDALTIVGTNSEDVLSVAPPRYQAFGVTNEWVEVDDPRVQTDGQSFAVEILKLQLLGGDDSVLVEPTKTTLNIDGGSGDDEVDVDAKGTVIGKGVTGDVTNLSVVNNDVGYLQFVGTTTVEDVVALNETVVATATGPGGGPHVRLLRTNGDQLASFYAYGANFSGGVNVAMGDLDGDGEDEVITGVGPGGGPHVRAFHSDGTDTGTSFFAYDSKFTGGVNVAAVDLDGDGISEIVTAPASDGGPHIRIWSGDGELLDEWFAPLNSGGFNVARGAALGELGGDQILLSLVGGSASQVVAFEEDGSRAPQFSNLQPFDPAFSGGASVARAELGSGQYEIDRKHNEIVTAAGPGGSPEVRVYRSSVVNQYDLVYSFLAFNGAFSGGVNVATCNLYGGDDYIVVGAGPGGAPHVRLTNIGGITNEMSFFAYGENFHGGVRVACGGGGVRKL